MALDSGRFDMREVFLRLREEMLANLTLAGLQRHGASTGNAAEQTWRRLFESFLPGRYRTSPAFVVDASGNRSRQLDIVIYDTMQAPALFPHSSGLHIPVESIYAVLEVKSRTSRGEIHDAGAKAASVRALRSATGRSPLAGIVCGTAHWSDETFREQLTETLAGLEEKETIDLGCILQHGAFEVVKYGAEPRICSAEESLAFFMIRLAERLRALPAVKPIDLTGYGKGIEALEN